MYTFRDLGCRGDALGCGIVVGQTNGIGAERGRLVKTDRVRCAARSLSATRCEGLAGRDRSVLQDFLTGREGSGSVKRMLLL